MNCGFAPNQIEPELERFGAPCTELCSGTGRIPLPPPKKNMKYPPGLVPVNFNLAGKILLVISLLGIAAKIVAYFSNWFAMPNFVFYISLGLLVVSLYLIFAVPKEKV